MHAHVVRDNDAGGLLRRVVGDGDVADERGCERGEAGEGGWGEELGVEGGADGGVAGKGDAGAGREDVVDDGGRGAGGRLVQEDGLGEVELGGDALFLGLGRGLGGFGARRAGNADYGERVAEVAGRGEDVEGGEGKMHFDYGVLALIEGCREWS